MTNQGKLWKNIPWFFKELTLAFRDPWPKNVFLSQYLFIAILCAKMSRVNKALKIVKVTIYCFQPINEFWLAASSLLIHLCQSQSLLLVPQFQNRLKTCFNIKNSFLDDWWQFSFPSSKCKTWLETNLT